MPLLVLSLLALDVGSLPHGDLDNPDWWWKKMRGPVTAAWYPEVWDRVVVSKYSDPKDREKVSRFGWLIRHPFYPLPEKVGWVMIVAVLVAPAIAAFMTPRRHWSTPLWKLDSLPKWEWNRIRAILGAAIYVACIIMIKNYFINYSAYYLMLGNLNRAYHILYLWVMYIGPPLLVLGVIIPLILVFKLRLPYRRAKASILIVWSPLIAILITSYVKTLIMLHTLGG